MERVFGGLRPAVQVQGRVYRARPLLRLMRESQVPAVSIAVIKDGSLVWARAYGEADPSTHRGATVSTRFQAASISKPVAATAALALVDRGALDLDRPVNDRLRSWRLPDSAFTQAKPVTLRLLLTHTAGLTVHGFEGYAVGAPLPTLPQILDGAPPANSPAVRVERTPGEAWSYSGGGFTVVQLLMTDATGEPFPGLMDRLVLKPLGMISSRYGDDMSSGGSADLALGVTGDGRAIAGGHHVYPELAAAGLWTTPSDLALWLQAFCASAQGADGGILAPATARAMLTPGLGDWGLGLAVRGHGSWTEISHHGANAGFRSLFKAYPQRGEGIVVMTNGDNGEEVIDAILIGVSRSLGWPDQGPRVLRPAATPLYRLTALVGRYSGDGVVAEVYFARSMLMVRVIGERPVELIGQGGDAFADAAQGEEVRFLRGPGGRVTGVAAFGTTLHRQSKQTPRQ